MHFIEIFTVFNITLYLQANPGNIASAQGLRNVMGVSYQSTDSSPSTFITSQATSHSNVQTTQSTTPVTSQTIPPVQPSIQIPVNQPVITGSLQSAAVPTLEPTIPSGTVYSSNIISHQTIVSSYQPTIVVSSAMINQQAELIQPTSISYQTAVTPPSTSIPFQPTNVNTLNQQITVGDIGVLGQGIQNIPDMNSGVSTINDDDSDIEMDISEFLQFPSS